MDSRLKEAIQNQASFISVSNIGTGLEDVVRFFEVARKMGVNIAVEFNNGKNDVRLYALLDDRNSCYKKTTGMNYDDYMVYKRERSKRIIRTFDEDIISLEQLLNKEDNSLE